VSKIVLLNNIDHADLRVAVGYGPAFGDAINQVRVFPTEFEALQREYPILFRQAEDGEMQAVALLGLDRDENLFLDGDAWRARYVPAMQRRGPFSIGLRPSPEGGAPLAEVNVDLEHPRLASGEGEAVFRRHGGATPYLEGVTAALSDIYDGLDAARRMFAAFEALELVAPVTIDITVGEGRRYELDAVFTINAERLAALDGAALAQLHQAGWLAAAFQAASSLGNIGRIVELKNRKEGWG
jgi:hypothetical protein